MGVDELGKPPGALCEHELRRVGYRPGSDDPEVLEAGCKIYEKRPASCRTYSCLWLMGAATDDARPDLMGAILDAGTLKNEETGEEKPIVHFIETRRAAFMDQIALVGEIATTMDRMVLVTLFDGTRIEFHTDGRMTHAKNVRIES
jgi:hypothetical protein